MSTPGPPVPPSAHGAAPVSSTASFYPAIADHELIRCIGRGSYGEVWLGRNVMGEYRAIKIVYRSSFDSDRPYEREFNGIRQFEPISRSHPSQLSILHVGKAEGYFYYVMELADDGSQSLLEAADSPGGITRLLTAGLQTYIAKTLRSELDRRGRLPASECLEIGLALTTALDHLHQHGLVHRDVKPSNVIFVNGIPKLADIGLVTGIDLSHSFVGTEGFVPPEGPGTPAADLYGLGKVLYETSTGKDRHDFPEPPTLLAELDDREELLELHEVLQKACAALPHRYQSAAQMHQDLLVLKTGKSLRRTHQLERRLALMTRAALAILAVVVLAVVPYFMAIREAGRARRAEADAKQKLWRSYLAEARATRNSGRAGQRFASLEAVQKAAALHSDLAVRNEAINSLAVSDLRVFSNAVFNLPQPGAEVCFDEGLERYAVIESTNTVALYSVNDRRLVARFPAPPGLEAKSIPGFSPNHCFLAVDYEGVGQKHLFQVWDLKEQKAVLSDIPGNIGQGFSSDSTLFAVSESNAVLFCSLASGQTARVMPMARKFDCLAFAPDGSRLACARFKHSAVEIYDVGTGQFLSTIPCPAIVVCMAWSSDGKLLATGCGDKRVYVWQVESGRQYSMLEGHTGKIADVVFHPNGGILASSGEDDSIRLWNLDSRYQIAIHPGGGGRLQFSHDGQRIGGFRSADTFGVLEVAYSREYRRLFAPFSGTSIAGPDFSPDGRLVVAGTGDQIRFWDTLSRREAASFLPVGECDTPLFHPDGQRLITAERYGGVFSRGWHCRQDSSSTIYQVDKPQCLYDGQNLRDAALSRDGRYLAVVDHDKGQLVVLNLNDLSRKIMPGSHAQADYIALSPDGHWAATGSWQNSKVMVWDLVYATNRTLAMPHRTRVTFSPDGQWLGTSSTEYRLWRVGTWEPKGKPIAGYSVPDFNFMAFSPDSRLIAMVDAGRNIRLLETASGAEIASLEAPEPTPIFALSFSPDGAQLVALEWDQQLQLWDLRLIRDELRQMKLDWNLPPYPRVEEPLRTPIAIQIDSGPFSLEELARSIPPRDASTPPNLIDLTPYYNLSLGPAWHYGNGPSGLSAVPRGRHTLAGIPFDVRGLIRVGNNSGPGQAYPEKISGISIGRTCANLHFLHAAISTQSVSANTRAGSYRIHYANGRTVECPIIIGENLDDCFADREPTNHSFVVAWTGTTPLAGPQNSRIHLFQSTWTNATPDERILSIDLVSNPSGPSPFLVALTAQ